MNQKEPVLRLENIDVNFGGVHALKNISLSFDKGDVVGLMGANGAGKSTLLKVIFGLVEKNQGKIIWQGKIIKPLPHKMVECGMSFVPQGKKIFQQLTVMENLEIGGVNIKNRNILKERIKEVLDLFPALKDKINEKTKNLSGGQQQMLAIARGLITHPQLLLLDEPSLGLAPNIVSEVFKKIKEINQKTNMTIVVVEHNIKSLLQITDKVFILDKGSLVYTGVGTEIFKEGVLEKVFLGKI
ncbi:MAG: ABC transporter ATP-binding protein [bacterium]